MNTCYISSFKLKSVAMKKILVDISRERYLFLPLFTPPFVFDSEIQQYGCKHRWISISFIHHFIYLIYNRSIPSFYFLSTLILFSISLSFFYLLYLFFRLQNHSHRTWVSPYIVMICNFGQEGMYYLLLNCRLFQVFASFVSVLY